MRKRGVVIGARRTRQGIGGFLARCLERAGVEVVGVVGTSMRTAELARDELLDVDVAVTAYASLGAALEEERPDFVAVCSPFEFHRAQLLEVAAAGCHALCEKPLWWDDEDRSAGEREDLTRELAEAFRRRGRYLGLVTQWPCTLPTFRALHPAALVPPRRFAMHLSPARSGVAMVLDSLSHPISMLWELCGPGSLEDVRVSSRDGSDRSLLLEATRLHAHGATLVEVRLDACERPPRAAGYALDGFAVERTIELPDYRQYLEHDGRRTFLPDPLQDLAADFAQALRTDRGTDALELVQSVVQLERCVSAAHRWWDEQGVLPS